MQPPTMKDMTANSVKILDSQHLLRVFIFIFHIFAFKYPNNQDSANLELDIDYETNDGET